MRIHSVCASASTAFMLRRLAIVQRKGHAFGFQLGARQRSSAEAALQRLR
jgi:hypothetical protein